jgi:hypothetical protein
MQYVKAKENVGCKEKIFLVKHEKGWWKYVKLFFMCQIIKVEQIKTLGFIQPLEVPNNNW